MPPSPARFILVRRLPTGEIGADSVAFVDIPRAAAAAARILKDDAGVGSATARLFADALARRPVGTVWGHPNGYDFRILIADFTVDRVPIIPDLRVLDYDYEWGAVESTQFMSEQLTAPGGQLFDNWYLVQRDGESAARKKFNGERLATKDVNSGNGSGS